MRLGVAAALLGSLRGAAELAFDYVRERKQYGAAIGTFQAVQHLCADMMVDLESCRSVVFAAAWTADNASAEEAQDDHPERRIPQPGHPGLGAPPSCRALDPSQ